jgi:hypothetical protein
MLNKDLLDLIDFLALALRTSDLPFGGMCVIFAGDPLQLPSVVVGRNPEEYRQ